MLQSLGSFYFGLKKQSWKGDFLKKDYNIYIIIKIKITIESYSNPFVPNAPFLHPFFPPFLG